MIRRSVSSSVLDEGMVRGAKGVEEVGVMIADFAGLGVAGLVVFRMPSKPCAELLNEREPDKRLPSIARLIPHGTAG